MNSGLYLAVEREPIADEDTNLLHASDFSYAGPGPIRQSCRAISCSSSQPKTLEACHYSLLIAGPAAAWNVPDALIVLYPRL
jgi:hypothetical protein